jgi:hypothetical protein
MRQKNKGQFFRVSLEGCTPGARHCIQQGNNNGPPRQSTVAPAFSIRGHRR